MDQSKLDHFAHRLAQLTIHYRWLVMLACIAIVAVVGYGAQQLSFATNYRIFFSQENPDLVLFEEFQATYTKNDNFLFVLKPKNGNPFSPRLAELQEKVTTQAWQIPYSIRVDSVSNFQHTWADEDNLTVEDLIKGGADLSNETLDEKRAVALAEPLILNNLIDPNADTVGINVVLQYPEKSLTEVPEAAAKAREIVAMIQRDYPDVEVALSGLSMMNNSFSEAGMMDAQTLIPIMYGVLLLITFLSLRSFSMTLVTLFVIMLSTVIAMGAGGWMLVQLTPVSMTAPTIVLTLAIADSIHILITMRELMKGGLAKTEALIESIRINFLAVTITTITTIVGFMALNFSDSPPFGHLGNMTAAGIAGAWLLSIFFLPAFLSLMPIKVKASKEEETSDLFTSLADWVIIHYKKLLVLGGGTAIVLSALVPTIALDDSWTKYFDESIQFRRDSDFAIQHLGGLYPIEFSIPAKTPGGVSDPEFLQHLSEFTDWLRAHPLVTHVYSLTDIMKRLNKNMHGDDSTYYALPTDHELSAQYLLLYELSLPYGLDLNDRINIDKSATRITATLDDVSTVETRQFADEAHAWLRENAPDYMHTESTGATVMFSHIAKRNIISMLQGNAVAIVLIAMVMVLSLRSWSIGMLSMIPNTIPILVTFGIWAILIGIVGMAAATVTATSLGIVVDDTVHFLTKYLRGRREKGYNAEDSVRYAFQTVGKAITVNTVILAFGFFVLALSSFKINQEMGLLTGIAVVSALILDFLLLPAILVALGKRSKSNHPSQGANHATA